MAAAFKKYDPKVVPAFKEEVCPTCVLKGKCVAENRDTSWFLACPHFHKWRLNIPDNWVSQQLKWQREHPEEAEAKHQEAVAKAWKQSKKKSTSKPKKDETSKQNKSRSTKGRKSSSKTT